MMRSPWNELPPSVIANAVASVSYEDIQRWKDEYLQLSSEQRRVPAVVAALGRVEGAAMITEDSPIGILIADVRALPVEKQWPAIRSWLREHRVNRFEEPERPPFGEWTETMGFFGFPGFVRINSEWYSEDAVDLCRLTDLYYSVPASLRHREYRTLSNPEAG